MKSINVFTDGSCLNNPGVGGYAICIVDNDDFEVFSDGEVETTNNRMEIKAVLLAFEKTKNLSDVNIYTDSSYVFNGFNTWMYGWKKNNWQKSDKTSILNIDLWENLYKYSQICKSHKVFWVKGHNGNKYNEVANIEAQKIAKEIKKSII